MSEVACLLAIIVEIETEREVASSTIGVGGQSPEMKHARWTPMTAALDPRLYSTGCVRGRLTRGVKRRLRMKESVPLANRSYYLSRRLCRAWAAPYSRVVVVAEAETAASVISEVCEEAGLGPRGAQRVAEHLGRFSCSGENSDGPNMAPTCLIVR